MKKQLFLFLLFSLSGFTLFSQPTSDKDSLSKEQKIYGLMTIWSEVKFGFPYPEKLEKINWEQKVLEYLPKVIKTKNVDEYYYVLMEFVTLLNDSHTSVLPPWGYFKPGYDTPPIELIIIKDKVYINRIGDSQEITNFNLKPGTEILEIDSIPVISYFGNNVLRYYTQGSKQSNEAVLPLYLLYGPSNKKVSLKVVHINGQTKNIVLSRNSKCKDGFNFMYKFVYNVFVAQNITVKRLKNNLLYVEVPSFENDQIANNFQKLIDTLDNSKINGLILDIRNNMGGSSKNSKKVVECLIEKPVTFPLMNYPIHSAAFKAWGHPTKWGSNKTIIHPRKGKKYLGPILILTNAVTASSAEDLVIGLKQTGRAKIIGQKTAGGAGNTLKFNLPGGGTFQLSTFKATYPDKTEYIGLGITPDVEIHLSLNDILKNQDRTLKTAINSFN